MLTTNIQLSFTGLLVGFRHFEAVSLLRGLQREKILKLWLSTATVVG